ncbi:unnamed protein product [Brassica rapa subsp. trilocularis]
MWFLYLYININDSHGRFQRFCLNTITTTSKEYFVFVFCFCPSHDLSLIFRPYSPLLNPKISFSIFQKRQNTFHLVFVWEEKKNTGISSVRVEEDDDGGRGGGGSFCIPR